MVVGLIKPDEGRVFLNDTDITKLPMYKRAQMGIGYLPQEASVFRKLSVENNILAVLEMTSLTKVERLRKLDELLDEFNLHHVRKNNGDSLSGGMDPPPHKNPAHNGGSQHVIFCGPTVCGLTLRGG